MVCNKYVLWLTAAGGIDMFIIGAGILLLMAGDKSQNRWWALLWRVLAYGILMIKPQGGFFIVALYILMRWDWKGLLISTLVYGVAFWHLYPDWLYVILHDPPLAQTVASHTLLAKFGLGVALVVAVLVVISRKWKYWELGGALAGILMPYGMPGMPIFLVLTGVQQLKAIPIIILYSALLALLTWVQYPATSSDYSSHLMSIYHLGMLGLALILCCIGERDDKEDTIAIIDWVRHYLPQTKFK